MLTLPLKEPEDAVTEPTVMFGVPDKPVALPVTLPVNAPSNDVAVQTPDTVKPAVNSGAPVPEASAKLSARTLPPDLPSAGNV